MGRMAASFQRGEAIGYTPKRYDHFFHRLYGNRVLDRRPYGSVCEESWRPMCGKLRKVCEFKMKSVGGDEMPGAANRDYFAAHSNSAGLAGLIEYCTCRSS